jgi:hypothetical protein
MARSWRDATPGAWAGAATPATVDDPGSGYRYQVEERDGSLSVTEALIDPPPDRPHELSKLARYIVGSGGKSFALVAEENGYLFELPVGHFADGEAWRLNPGYERHNQRFDRRINSACVACHGGVPDKPPGVAERFTTPVGRGVSCERCHGPGSLHVAHRKGPVTGAIEGVDRTIVNPARLTPERSLDVCLQCHLQGDVYTHPPGRDAFSFRPGRPLAEHRLDFLVRSTRADEMGIASHGTRMMQSRCFTASRGALTCVHCHDPHVPVESVSRSQFISRCLTCHQAESCRRVDDAPAQGERADCIACHMPRRSTREGIHLVSTDHLIASRTGQDDGDSRSYASRFTPNSDPELIPVWPEADPNRSALGGAYILLNEVYPPQTLSVERGMRLLEAARSQGAVNNRTVYATAVGHSALGKGREAIEPLRRLLQSTPADHEARFRLAIAYEQAKREPEAVAEYQRLLDDVPDWLEPYPRLARILLKRNEVEQAARRLEQQIALHSDPTALTGMAVVQILRGHTAKESLLWIDRALKLDPEHSMARRLRNELRGR